MSLPENVLRHLSKEEVERFVEESVKFLISHIELGDRDYINVNRVLINEGHAVFHHNIHIGPPEQTCDTDIWEDSEMFEKNSSNLYLYLKGRMLIQTTSTWTVYKGDPFKKQYEITCEYFVKEN